mgnify:CR=1 FL=1
MSDKIKRISYWFFTLWLCLGMVSTAIVQLLNQKEEIEMITRLGYPIYFLTLLGIWKLLWVLAVLIPKFLLLKEWAYAGFFFAMTGAAYSHIANKNPINDIFPSLLLLTLTILSWFLRPKERKIV